MKIKRVPAALISGCALCALMTAPMAQNAAATDLLAQAGSTSSTQAPSFFKQAGQMLLDSAQKRVINNLNQNLQNQQKLQSQPPSQPDPQYPSQTNSQYPSQQNSQYPSQQNSQYPNQPNPNQINSQYPQPGGQYPYGTNQQNPNLQNGDYPYGAQSPAQSNPPYTALPNVPPGAPASGSNLSNAGSPTTAPQRKVAAPCRSWLPPDQTPVACLLCIHGLGLQSNSYEFFGKEQARRGLAVYAIDVRGFGSWMNAKGKTKVNFDDCLDDIKTSLESIRAANPGKPVYLLGESMGGAIALRAASLYPGLVDGLISSVPAGERFNQGRTSMKVFLNLLTGFNVANVGNDLVNQATQNQKLKSQWQDDPLSRLNLSPQELIQFQDFMNFNHDAAKKVTDMPVLFVQGTGDQLVKPEGTWELFNDVAAKDKSFFAVPGEHLIFEEAQTQDPGPRDQNFRVISSWLTAKVGRRGRRNPLNTIGAPGAPGGVYGGPAGFGGRAPINLTGLEGPAQMLDNRQYTDAINALEQIRTQKPTDPNVLALLGKAYFQSGSFEKAGPLFRQAMRIRRAGGDQAQAFNSYLLNIGGQGAGAAGGYAGGAAAGGYGSGAAGAYSGSSGTSGGYAGASGAPTAKAPAQPASPFDKLSSLFGINTTGGASQIFAPASKAKVYAFYASWADQCKGMNDAMAQLANTYGNRVEINRVNIEDSANDALADQFKIGPIPTVVFVSPTGKVGQTIIGESTFNNYARALDSVTNLQ